MTTTDDVGRVNNLRLGESILLGRDPLSRDRVCGLHTDACTFVAEVIESKRKPTRPWGRSGQNAFGEFVRTEDRGEIWQTILAAGRQDIDPGDLRGPADVHVLSASSDHLIVETPERMAPGDELSFEVGYSALLRSMTSPFVDKRHLQARSAQSIITVSSRRSRTEPASPDRQSRRAKLTLIRPLTAH